MEMMGCHYTGRGQGTVALVAIMEIIKEMIPEAINRMYVFFTTTPWSRCYCHPHFKNEDTEAQVHPIGMGQSQGRIPGIPTHGHSPLPCHTAPQPGAKATALEPHGWAQHSPHMNPGLPDFQGCALLHCRMGPPGPSAGSAHRGLDRPSNHGNEVCGLRLARPLVARTHHEVIELRGPGHELGPAHGHTDLHEAGVLAGLGLPHLTHDPAGRRGQTPWVTGGSQDSQQKPLGPTPPQTPCSAVGSQQWAGKGEVEDIPDSSSPGLLLGSQEWRRCDVRESFWSHLESGETRGRSLCSDPRHSAPNS